MNERAEESLDVLKRKAARAYNDRQAQSSSPLFTSVMGRLLHPTLVPYIKVDDGSAGVKTELALPARDGAVLYLLDIPECTQIHFGVYFVGFGYVFRTWSDEDYAFHVDHVPYGCESEFVTLELAIGAAMNAYDVVKQQLQLDYEQAQERAYGVVVDPMEDTLASIDLDSLASIDLDSLAHFDLDALGQLMYDVFMGDDDEDDDKLGVEFFSLVNLLMTVNPWPVSEANKMAIHTYMDKTAQMHGFESMSAAYASPEYTEYMATMPKAVK